MDTKRSKLIASVRLAEGSLEHHAAPSTLLINSYASPARRGLSEPHFSDRVESAGLVEGRRRQIEASLEAALQREQRMELRWYQLVRHKLWGYQRCDEQHPPPLPDETEWLGDMPWPRGVSPDGGFFRLCGAFCAFIYNLPCAGKTPRCLWYSFMLGALPVATSTLLSITILHVQTASEGALSGTASLHGARRTFATLCIAVLLTGAAAKRLEYQFQLEVPLSGVRFHMRHALQRRLLRLHAEVDPDRRSRSVKNTAARLTPGTSAQLLDPLTAIAVNSVWGFVFEIPRLAGSLLASVCAGVVTRHNFGLAVPCLYVGSALLAWLLVCVVFFLHKAPRQELAHLKAMWNLRYGSLAAEQAAAVMRTSDGKEADVDAMVDTYAKAAFVFRRRAFHDKFMSMVYLDHVAAVQFASFGIAFVALAVLAMDPASGVDEDVFAAGSALLLSATQQASHLATRLDSLIYGHVALAQLADVLNAS